MAAAGRARELLLPLLFLPLAIPIVVGGVGASVVRRARPLPRLPRASTTRLRDACLGHLRVRGHGVTGRFTLSLGGRARCCGGGGRRLRSSSRARGRRPGVLAADLLLPRPDRAHRVRLLRRGAPGRRSGISGRASSARPRELHRDPPGRHLRRADAGDRARSGRRSLGHLVDAGARTSSCSSSSSSSSTRAYFMLRFSVEPGPAAGEHLRRLRALRRRADPGQLPRHPAREELHPPDRLHAGRAADVGDDVLRLLRLPGRRCSCSRPRSTGSSWPASGSTRACASCASCSR